jgi:hypothetical protein
VLVAVPAYAVQRFFFHACLHVIWPAIFGAIGFLIEGFYWHASVCAGIAVASYVYRHAFYESRDVRQRGATGLPQKSSPEAK